MSLEDSIKRANAWNAMYKQLAEYKQKLEAAEAKLREFEMQEPVATLQMFGEQISFSASPIQLNILRGLKADARSRGDIVQLYAKQFPAPKQEEK